MCRSATTRGGGVLPASSVLFLIAAFSAQAGSLRAIGPMPGAPIDPPASVQSFVVATSVSSDGAVVAGVGRVEFPENHYKTVPFRYVDGVIESPHTHPDFIDGEGVGLSRDGVTVFWRTFRDIHLWQGDQITQLQPATGADPFPSLVSARSPDARTFTGQEYDTTSAYRIVDGVFEKIVDAAGVHDLNTGSAISPDGSIVIGATEIFQAYRWIDGEILLLGDLGGEVVPGLRISFPAAMTPDGNVIAGASLAPDGIEPFRWENGVMESLGSFGESELQDGAYAISTDGTVIIGQSAQQPFYWTEASGLLPLAEVIAAAGIDTAGWEFLSVGDISDDGMTVVGTAERDGEIVGFIADLAPDPIEVEIDVRPGSPVNRIRPGSRGIVPVALLGSAEFDVLAVDASTLAFGPGGAAPAFGGPGWVFDVNRDGYDDRLSFYRIDDSGIQLGDVEACVTGETEEGAPFEGCDAIQTVPSCGLGVELLPVLSILWLTARARERRRTRVE